MLDLWWLLALIAVVLAAAILYLSSTAGRLDRLHRRVEVAYDNLVAALDRRHVTATNVAANKQLEPATRIAILDAVGEITTVKDQPPARRALAESELSKILNTTFDDPLYVNDLVREAGGDDIAQLADACRRVEIGRRFYNDALIAASAMRDRRLVRIFRLQGTATLPESVEMIDTPPAGFSGR